ncbi:MAG: hypothetical protein WCK48_00460 [bacterium]
MIDLERLTEVVTRAHPLEDERIIFVDRGQVTVFVVDRGKDGSVSLRKIESHVRQPIVIEKFGEKYEIVSSHTSSKQVQSELHACAKV